MGAHDVNTCTDPECQACWNLWCDANGVKRSPFHEDGDEDES